LELLQDAEVEICVETYLRIKKFCLFSHNIYIICGYSATPHIGGCSSICNMSTCHVVVTDPQLQCLWFLKMSFTPLVHLNAGFQ